MVWVLLWSECNYGLSVNMLSVIKLWLSLCSEWHNALRVIMLWVSVKWRYVKSHSLECHQADCSYAECFMLCVIMRSVVMLSHSEYQYADYHYAESRFTECHCFECHYTECRSAIVIPPISHPFKRRSWFIAIEHFVPLLTLLLNKLACLTTINNSYPSPLFAQIMRCLCLTT